MAEVTVVEILKRARDLVGRGWCQGASARNARGEPVLSGFAAAASHCTMGALHAAVCGMFDLRVFDLYFDAARRMEAELRSRYHPHYGKRLSLARWNDQKGRTQAEVVALFEETIASLK